MGYLLMHDVERLGRALLSLRANNLVSQNLPDGFGVLHIMVIDDQFKIMNDDEDRIEFNDKLKRVLYQAVVEVLNEM